MSIEDKELDEMFHGEEKPLHPDTIHQTFSKPSVAVSKKETTTTGKTAQKTEPDFKDAKWEPAKPDPNWLDKLKDSVKWIGGFGGLSCLIFYWNEAGLMDASIAIPAMCVCTALAGWGMGKNVRCK